MKHGKIFRILVIALILSLLPVVIPSTPAMAAPVITVSPTSGAIGTLVTLTGTNFESYRGDEIHVFFDSVELEARWLFLRKVVLALISIFPMMLNPAGTGSGLRVNLAPY